MKNNEYNAAEAVEIGKAEKMILGHKGGYGLDASGEPPFDWFYNE